jgi:hypothetical protein
VHSGVKAGLAYKVSVLLMVEVVGDGGDVGEVAGGSIAAGSGFWWIMHSTIKTVTTGTQNDLSAYVGQQTGRRDVPPRCRWLARTLSTLLLTPGATPARWTDSRESKMNVCSM